MSILVAVESSGEPLEALAASAVDVNTLRTHALERRLRGVRNVGPVIANAIATERDERGPFQVRLNYEMELCVWRFSLIKGLK